MSEQELNYEEWDDEFDDDFDDELDPETIAVLDGEGAILKEMDEATQILVPERVKDVLHVYKLMKQAMEGTKTTVTYELNKPFKRDGGVTVTGKKICFPNPKLFMKAVNMASTFSVTPKLNGTVEITFGFDGLTKIIEE